MKALKSVLAAATIVGALAAGAAAAEEATGPEVTLTDDQAYAVNLVREFQSCVVTGYEDPAFLESIEAYEAAATEAMEEYMELYEAYAPIDEKWHAEVDAFVASEGFLDRLALAETEAEYNAVVQEANEAILAKFGPHPEEPAMPSVDAAEPVAPELACQEEALSQLAADGKTEAEVQESLGAIYEQYGEETLIKLITPAP